MSENNKKRYRCDCFCGNTFLACKSIFQEWGKDDAGRGSCPRCNTSYNLTFDAENECMKLTEWDEYIETPEKEREINDK